MAFNPQSNKWKVGDKIADQYEIYKIKAGGMGIVYICYDHKHKTPLVLKTFQEKFFISEQSSKLFEREALLWIELERFTYIVRAYGVDKLEGRLFIILEYVAPDDLGRNTLKHYLDNLSFPEILKFGIQFCCGMEYAYSKGIKCHRDIKPDNIMITRDKAVKITDFGLAKAFDASEKKGIDFYEFKTLGVYQTKNGIRGGTLPFMAPEQFDGCSDKRSDIYSFGVVLYQMASGGELPFIGKSPEEYEALHKLASIPMLSSKVESSEKGILGPLFGKRANNSDISLLFPIIKVCLEKNPELRFQNFNVIRQKFEQLLLKETGEVISPPDVKEFEAWEWNCKGVSLGNLGRFDEAIQCYDEAIGINPKSNVAWSNKGISLGNLGRHEEAITCFNESIRLDPKYAAAWANKGVSLANSGRHEEAITCYDEAIRLNPKYEMDWHNKGISLRVLRRNGEAIRCFDEALRINPKYADAWYNKGVVLGRLDRYDEAVGCLDEAIIINPKYADAWYKKGLFLLNFGRREEAIRCFDEALRIKPEYFQVWFNKGISLGNLGRHEEAISCFNESIRLDPKDADVWFNKGIALSNLGRYEETIKCLDEVSMINPKNADAWASKGVALYYLERYKEALVCFENTLKINPNETKAHEFRKLCIEKMRQ